MTIVKNTTQVNGQEITIYVEVDGEIEPSESIYSNLRDNVIQRTARKVVEAADDIFGEGLDLAAACAARIVANIEFMDDAIRPDEYEAQFAIRLGGEGGAAIVKGSADAQLQISMKWAKAKHD